MPDFVINTGPIIALTAAVGELKFLESLYESILLPREVYRELAVCGEDCPELRALRDCKVVECIESTIDIPQLLRTQLDIGEASVIQHAIAQGIGTFVIDEKLGRRLARLHDLRVTGSLGILIKAARAELIPDLEICFKNIRNKDIWISAELQRMALEAVRS